MISQSQWARNRAQSRYGDLGPRGFGTAEEPFKLGDIGAALLFLSSCTTTKRPTLTSDKLAAIISEWTRREIPSGAVTVAAVALGFLVVRGRTPHAHLGIHRGTVSAAMLRARRWT